MKSNIHGAKSRGSRQELKGDPKQTKNNKGFLLRSSSFLLACFFYYYYFFGRTKFPPLQASNRSCTKQTSHLSHSTIEHRAHIYKSTTQEHIHLLKVLVFRVNNSERMEILLVCVLFCCVFFLARTNIKILYGLLST